MSRDTFDTEARYAKDCGFDMERDILMANGKNIGFDTSGSKDCQDMVNHPSHYERYDMETIEAIKGQSTPDEYRGFLKGNIMKYLARYLSKNGYEDLEKAQWYLETLHEYEVEHGFWKG